MNANINSVDGLCYSWECLLHSSDLGRDKSSVKIRLVHMAIATRPL